jgi:HSP20-like domain of unknown function (DUF1813).
LLPVFSFPIAVKEPVNAILRQRSFSKAQRRMKIGYVSIRHLYHHNYTATWFSRSPSLRLNGNWMAEAGFSTDTPVIVSVEQG